ncbi:MAG: NAD(P)/FAD-dependent oxidoreductase [Halobacteriaceae archaeon]
MTEEIVIVGGGTGGTVLANRLADHLDREIGAGEVAITLVNDTPDHVYKPGFLYVAFGQREVADGVRPLRELVDDRVELTIDRVTDVDTEAQRLSFAGGNTREYDHLVLATGATLAPDEVPGFQEGAHHFYGADGAESLRDALATFTEGRLVLSVIGVPHMCPAAPVEFVLMADDWFRQRGLREDIEITYTYPIQRAHGIESVAEWATEEFEDRDIELATFVNPERVDAEAGALETMEGERLEYDLLVGIPPHTGSPLIADAGLGEDGWVPVDNHTLAADDHDNVYAIGDAADVPTSKAGSVAHYQAGVLAQRLASVVRGHHPTARYDGKTICFIEAGMDRATFLEFSYGDEPTVPTPSRTLHWSKLGYNESYWLTAKGVL